jgi:hypothetical protein
MKSNSGHLSKTVFALLASSALSLAVPPLQAASNNIHQRIAYQH